MYLKESYYLNLNPFALITEFVRITVSL